MASKSPIWIAVSAENLIRHRSGTYFLNAKINGNKVRKSLNTDNLRQAKVNRDVEIEKLRRGISTAANGYGTIGEALAMIEQQTMADPSHKKSTKTFYKQVFPLLRKSLPLEKKSVAWTKDEVKAWWAEFSKTRSSSQCNICLHTVRRTMKAVIDAGIRGDDPTSGIKRKRTEKPSVDDLPNVETLDAIITSIREDKRAAQGANMVEFLAWSGLRISELTALEWSHIGDKWITVTGGEEGTKNHEVRRVPINPRLRKIIAEMRYNGAAGKVFTNTTPRKALNSACERLGVRHMRVHDLRHWFATHAIEKGVDIPTVSKWLGHKDGGALAMRVYGHLRDDHSLSAAQKMG